MASFSSSRIVLAPERGRVSIAEIVLLLICVGLIVAPLPHSLTDVIVLSFLFAGLALAWNIAGGYAGLISFGQPSGYVALESSSRNARRDPFSNSKVTCTPPASDSVR